MITLLLMLAAVIALIADNRRSTCYVSILAMFISVTIYIACGLSFLFLCMNNMITISTINKYNATKTTIEMARNNPNISQIELAALQTKVVEVNDWLANAQYWNNSIFDEYIPDAVDALQPLQ